MRCKERCALSYGKEWVMTDSTSSPLQGFRKLSVAERIERLSHVFRIDSAELRRLCHGASLPVEIADHMVENVIGTYALPLALGLNLLVNGRDYVVPMVIEEPSVVAAASFAAKLVRGAGGFEASADESVMIAQIQLADYGDPFAAMRRILAETDRILALADSAHPQMVARGGGAKDLEVRLLAAPERNGEPLLVVQLMIDTQDAMGANLVNTAAERVAPLIEELTGGRVYLRILSNLADRRLARASCRVPLTALADFGLDGREVANGIVQACRFAAADPYRAATHNKGVMNGIDAVAIATGQDWRAIEAGAHAFACREGRYRPLTTWTIEGDHLCGAIELPMALGIVGGPVKIHPGAQTALRLMRITSARELATVFAAVGLAQNLAALRALGSVGIQRGHMAMHARSVAVAAGATGDRVEEIARLLVRAGQVKVDKAREILAALVPDAAAERVVR
jgi:hydroxymethylglutaryl-CoA reductase